MGLTEAERADVDERWRSDLTDAYDDIIGVVRAAILTRKKVRIQRDCKKCGCSHMDYVEVEDVDSAIKAAEFLSNRALGRPSQQKDGESEERITFTRKVIFEGNAPA